MNTTINFRTSLLISCLTIGLSSPVFAAKEVTAESGKQSNTVQNPYAKPKPTTIVKPNSKQITPPTNYIAKPTFKLGPVKTKLYRVPGNVAIAAAKRHGYSFGIRTVDIPNGCKFVGMNWHVPRNTRCSIYAFEYRDEKCFKLRKGWEITEYKLNNFVNNVTHQRANSWNPPRKSTPFFEIYPDNSDGKSKKDLIISIDHITLKGPEGKFNKFEEAFSHCNDPSYRP